MEFRGLLVGASSDSYVLIRAELAHTCSEWLRLSFLAIEIQTAPHRAPYGEQQLSKHISVRLGLKNRFEGVNP